MSAPISKLEYLKKYMSPAAAGDKERKIKKKKLKAAIKSKAGVRIIDEEIDLRKIKAGYEVDEDLVETQEDAPQVAAVIDERSIELKTKQDFIESSKWKRLTDAEIEAQESKEAFHKIANKTKHLAQSSRSENRKTRHDSDSDASPVRQHQRSNYDSDPSPPRKQSASASSAQRKRHDSDSDTSPPRKQTNLDRKPVRKRHDSDSDPSPPRRRHDSDSDPSPPRKRHDSNQSPSRKLPEVDSSPPRRKTDSGKRDTRIRHDSDSDQSPPRTRRLENAPARNSTGKIKRSDSDSDNSPIRKRDRSRDREERKGRESREQRSPKRSRDMGGGRSHHRSRSPPRHKKGASPDQSPPRRKCRSSSDSSPPRRESSSKKHAPSDVSRNKSPTSSVPEKRKTTLEGKRAGLQTGQDLRKEAEAFRRREDETFRQMDKSLTGEGATTSVRASKRRMMEEKLQKEQEKEEKRKKLQEATNKWSKGIKQQEAQSSRLAEDIHEMEKPLARYANDEDLERMLREQEREGDPMAQYLAKKKAKSGDPKANRPVYKGPAPPNRFGILPGYRWDGVDRSNGFEKMYFEKKNKALAVQDEAYKWSVSDM